MYSLYVGIDISATQAHVFWQDAKCQQVGQMVLKYQAKAYRRLAHQLKRLCPNPQQTLLVMEATANYWLDLALFLHDQHFAVSVINPLQGKRFAQMQLRRAKTDAIDAQMLCDFARMVQPTLWTPPPAIYHQLQQRLALRDDLVQSRTPYRNRLHAMNHHPHAESSLRAILLQQIEHLTHLIEQLEQEIQHLLKSDHHWRMATERLLSIPGIGALTAAWILTTTHCFARCETPQQAAAYAGLVPHPYQSGQSSKKGKTGGGHQALRSILYMAAGAALQHNPILRPFYQRLVQHGKLKNVARVAVARKLMHMAWACVVKNRDFDPHYQHLACAA